MGKCQYDSDHAIANLIVRVSFLRYYNVQLAINQHAYSKILTLAFELSSLEDYEPTQEIKTLFTLVMAVFSPAFSSA